MRQFRFVVAGQKYYWIDFVNDKQYLYLRKVIEGWRKDKLSFDDVRLEWRNKPNVFTRIKEWWNNE